METIKVMGGKWKPRILWHLREGPATFGDLRRVVGVSENHGRVGVGHASEEEGAAAQGRGLAS
jgi:hypothetical protein